MLELNQIYSWNEIVQCYPDKWAVLTDVVRVDGEIKTCKLLDICTKAEKHLYRQKYIDLGIKFQIQRTTNDNDPNSGICFLI